MQLATFQMGNAFILYDAGILCDAASLSQISDAAGDRPALTPHWFTPAFWKRQDAIIGQAPGRGTSLFIDAALMGIDQQWALRPYRRGGLVARISESHYVWTGLEHTRAFCEMRLTATLHARGLPVPTPLAGCVWRHGLTYQAALLTVRITGANALAELLPQADDALLERVGRTVRQFHAAGLDHVDLNARNLLITPDERIWLIDLDRCRLRRPGRWQARNLQRLERSIERFAPGRGENNMHRLMKGYQLP